MPPSSFSLISREVVRPYGQARSVVAIVPAHNEENLISATLDSLKAQTVPLSAIVVISDNSTDRTVSIALEHAVHVLETTDNTAKKAGALNQALQRVLPHLEDDDIVLVMDADSRLQPDFLANALLALNDPGVGAASVACWTFQDRGLLHLLQAMEFARCRRMVARRGAQTMVMSGAATAVRVSVLRELGGERGRSLPGQPGSIYAEDSLTEDYELTVAVARLGYRTLQPRTCVGWTDTMPTLAALWQQRLRWQRGTLETLARYGWLPQTRRMWAYVVLGYLSSLMPLLFVLALWLTWHLTGSIEWQPLWLAPTILVLMERVVTVKVLGRRAVTVAVTVVLESLYDLFRSAVYWHALLLAVLRVTPHWHAALPGAGPEPAPTRI